MNKDQFDDLIKNKMDSMSTPMGDDTWSIFEKILDADDDLHIDNGDESFDNTIKEKLSTNHHVSADTQWHSLKEKLNNIQKRRDSIYLSKVMELVAVFLVIFTLNNFGGYFMPAKEEVPQNNPIHFATIIDKGKSASETKESTPSPIIERKNGNVADHNGRKKDIIAQVNAKQNLEIKNSVFSENQIVANKSNTENSIPNIEVVDSENQNIALLELNNGEEFFDNSNVISLANEATSDDVFENDNIQIDPLPLQFEPLYTEMAAIFPMKISNRKGKTIKAISVFASADVNLINTPFDKLYSIPSYTKEALNNAYGLRLSTQKNNLEVESGIDYSRREYQPALFKEAFGNASDIYFETSLDKITFDVASIPLNLKYHFLNKKGWSSYLMVGAALNLIVNASYEIPTVLVEGRPSPDRYTPVRPRLDEKEFTEGLFNGHALKDNYFATAGFGIGIEKKIFNNTSLYVQPSYHRHLLTPGIGPKNDKIHTSSLQFGVKTILN